MAYNKEAWMEVSSVGAGAAVGYLVSEFANDKISESLTKDARSADASKHQAPSAVAFWRKAYTWDAAEGVTLLALGVWGPKMNKHMKLAAISAGSLLAVRGLVDGARDFMAADIDRTYSGRPLVKTDVNGAAAQSYGLNTADPSRIARMQAYSASARTGAMARSAPMFVGERAALF